MKKWINFMLLGFSVLLLASCAKKDSLSGKYYDIYDGDAKLVMEFTDNGGRFYKEGTHTITNIDTKNHTFTFSDNGKDYVVTFQLKDDGSMDYDMGNYMTGSNKDTAYKEGSESYKKKRNNGIKKSTILRNSYIVLFSCSSAFNNSNANGSLSYVVP